MAKSIRSKVMRRHRSELRKTVCEPLIQKRQEQLAANLQESMKSKSGKTIANLKAVFHTTNSSSTTTTATASTIAALSEPKVDSMEQQVDEVEVEGNDSQKQNKNKNGKNKMKKIIQKQSNKSLVWFS